MQINSEGQFFIGIVEDRNDPLSIHRIKVRVVGLHNHDSEVLPTEDLPWAYTMQPLSGTGSVSPPPEGSTVVVVFNDYPDCQMPIVIGSLPGIPQPAEKVINIDRYEPTPSYVDNIAPQGRQVPRNSSEVNGNQIGPVTAPNPKLSALVDGAQGIPAGHAPDIITTSSAGSASSITGIDGIKSSLTFAKTGIGAITSKLSSLKGIMTPTVKSIGAVGKMANSLNGIGTTFATTKNTFENLVLGQGSIDSAVDRFMMIAQQSGPLGNGIAAVMNGKSSLKSLQKDLKFGTLGNIQSSFNSISNVSIKSPDDVLGVLTNVEQIANQLTSAIDNIESITTTIENEFGFFSPDVFFTNAEQSAQSLIQNLGTGITDMAKSTIISLGTSAANMLENTGAEILGVLSAGAQQAQQLGGAVGDLLEALGADELAASLAADPLGLNHVLATPDNVAKKLNESFSGARDALTQNVGNFKVLQTKPAAQITAADFKDVPEGQTPPIHGAFGGPNFGGASAHVEAPTNPANDAIKYGEVRGADGEVPLEPPPYWKGNRTAAVAGIQALVAAAKKNNFTKEQTAALLGICGGESAWIPQNESCNYKTPDRLCTIFQSTFKGDMNLAQKYSNWLVDKKGTREEFFDFVYDPANNGRKVGNKLPGDGGKFFGRGFLQLTGRPNYELYAKMSGHDIVNNPQLLNDDLAVSADIACMFFLRCVPKNVPPTAHPQYFLAAKAAVGFNDPIVAARKKEFYEYFYGVKMPESYGYTDATAGSTVQPHSYDGAMIGNSMGTKKQGFTDPNGKYPKRRRIGEQGNSRLARGEINETIVSKKDSQRVMGIPVAMGGMSWSQPSPPFAAVYPFNHVRETEGGHIQEFDDTPGYERIQTYHKSGTFDEIDANGSKVTRIIGDDYTIIDRNGFIFIAGNANVTCNGNINILCQSDANIEVSGSAEMKIGGSMDIGVARDMNIAVEGDFSLWSNGAMNLQSKMAAHIRSNENLYVSSNKDINLYSDVNTNIHAVTLSADVTTSQLGCTTIGKFDGSLKGTADYATGAGTTGASQVTGSNPSPNLAEKALIHGMVPPPPGAPLNPVIQPLSPPPLLGEEKFMFELPVDNMTNLSQTYNKLLTSQEGMSNQRVMSTTMGAGGGGSIVPSSKQAEILNMTSFTADYKLSEHFTLGMMFDGGFNVKHKLVDQNGLTVPQIVANLAALCENILEKYLTIMPDGIYGLGKLWKINSGYRMGSAVSDHNKGRAVDIGLVGGDERKALHYELIQKLDKLVPYDQLILEYAAPGQTWIHTGFRGDGKVTYGGGTNRGMTMTMRDHAPVGDGFILLA